MHLRGLASNNIIAFVADIRVNDCVLDVGINICPNGLRGKSNFENIKPYIAYGSKKRGKDCVFKGLRRRLHAIYLEHYGY
jgi:hypothetical protein